MTGEERLTSAPGGSMPVESCWMCGIYLTVNHLVADGGSACASVRWYCLDTRACTQRWTARSARPAGIRHGTAPS
jgi:hypothetical protein